MPPGTKLFAAAGVSDNFSISARMAIASLWLTVATFWFPRLAPSAAWDNVQASQNLEDAPLADLEIVRKVHDRDSLLHRRFVHERHYLMAG